MVKNVQAFNAFEAVKGTKEGDEMDDCDYIEYVRLTKFLGPRLHGLQRQLHSQPGRWRVLGCTIIPPHHLPNRCPYQCVHLAARRVLHPNIDFSV